MDEISKIPQYLASCFYSKAQHPWKGTETVKRCCIFSLILMLTVSTGCKKDDPKDSDNKSKAQNQTEQKQQVTVVPQSGTGVRSPAVDSASQKLTVDTNPKIICEKFIAAVKSGDYRGWEKLLTQSAERHIRAAQVDLQIPGGEKSECSVNKVSYNSARQNVAIVSCIIENINNGTQNSFEISYLLKKKDVGWRISGIIVPTEKGSTDFLSFENTDDVAQIKSQSEEDTEVASNPIGKQYR